jgi:hypothetical protein
MKQKNPEIPSTAEPGGTGDANAVAVRNGIIIDIDSAENMLRKFEGSPGLAYDTEVLAVPRLRFGRQRSW